MRYLSVCSGIEAATAAWHPLGWEPAGFSEIEKFPSAVLHHHYPHITNYGDMNNYKDWDIGNIDLLVGGTPCQSFSVAGLRKGLDDPRGNLSLVYLGIAERFRPRWILWENVPGVLSSYSGDDPPSNLEEGQEWETEETSDFECFTTALGKLGYGFAYRILDAQYFGVPQRRRRVFVVGYLGDWRRAAAVLFERHSLSGDTPPSREKGERVAGGAVECFEPRSPDGHARVVGDIAPTLNRMGGCQREPCVVGTFQQNSMQGKGSLGWNNASEQVLRPVKPQSDHQFLVMAHGQGNAEIVSDGDPSLTCNHEAPICFNWQNAGNDGLAITEEGTGPLDCSQTKAVAFSENQRAEVLESDTIRSMTTQGGKPGQGYPAVRYGSQVRRLTPKECERLQGFPDNYTQIPWRNKPAEDCPDGPRYKALGNSMAVPCMKWIGERIEEVDNI